MPEVGSIIMPLMLTIRIQYQKNNNILKLQQINRADNVLINVINPHKSDCFLFIIGALINHKIMFTHETYSLNLALRLPGKLAL